MKLLANLDRNDDLNITSMRCLVLISHFVLTTGLVWTKIDSIQITIAFDDNQAYRRAKSNYETAIAFGLALLILRFVFFFLLDYGHVSILSIYHIIFDSIACLFIAWMVLDSFAWYYYLYVLFFCV
jgi:hypothetical protein